MSVLRGEKKFQENFRRILGFIVLEVVSSLSVSTKKGGAHPFLHLDRSISARFVPAFVIRTSSHPALMHDMHRQQED